MSDFIILSERIKELSRTEGTINFSLDGAVNGFSSFSDTYSSGDPVFYAITDGTDYEVGSGVYGNDGINSYIIRSSPFKSTKSDALVPFKPGVKEVYVTYPGKFSVFTASGLGSFEQPDVSGVAFWGSQNILDYDSAFIWDKTNNRLGVSESAPQYSIHVGGTQQTSKVAASGFVVGNSGVNFVGDDPSYSGGVQLEPFLRTELDVTTGTSAVFALSGLVDQRILFQTQLAGTVLAGPASGDCSGGCDPDYPVFRALALGDVPDLSTLYLVQKEDAYSPTMGSGIAFFSSSGVIDTDPNFAWNKTYNILDLKGDALISGQLSVGGNVVVTGNLDVQGDVTYIDSSTVTIWDKNLELASLSGAAQGGDSTIDDAGLIIKSTDGDKKWTWRDATDAWTTDEKIDISGIIFNDSSVISGAYQPGSGLELHNGLEFNIGNMFTVSADDAVTRNLHQADQLSISGISGISITSDKSGSLVTVTVDGGELSELASYTSGIAEYASGVAEYASGVAEYGSGTAEYASGVAEYASGVAEYGSGLLNSDSTITVSGVQANSFQLLSGGYVPVAESGYTLSNTDNGKVLLFSHNSDILLTVASGLDFGLATSFIQLGSGQIEVSGAAGVTIYNSQSHTKTNTQHSRAGLMHYAQDVYNFAGDTAT